MSDEEMNIDEGTFVYLFFLIPGRFLSALKWQMGEAPSGKRGRGFRVFLPCTVLYVLVLVPILMPCPSEQTYDSVESALARDVDTRVVRCERSCSSFFIVYVSDCDAYFSHVHVSDRMMENEMIITK
jgi:hypothetical protein